MDQIYTQRVTCRDEEWNNYKDDDGRIKDLRTGVESHNTQQVLDGALDPFIEAALKAGL